MIESADLGRELESFFEQLRRLGGAGEVRMLAGLARVFPAQAAQRGLLDCRRGVYCEDFFMRLIQAEIDSAAEAGLILFGSDRVENIRREQGAEVAEQVLGRLGEFLKSRQAAGEWLGRIGPDSLALLLPQTGLLSAQERAQALHDAARLNLRFPTSTGLSHTRDLSGGAAELARLAREAAAETRRACDRRIRARTARGPVAAPVATSPPAAAEPSGTSLAARYQRLVLLNRMSLELFSGRPFAEALAQACSTILALTGAQYVAVYFCDALGRPGPAQKYGPAPAAGDACLREEADLVARALEARRILTVAGMHCGWLAAPLLPFRNEGVSEDGAFVLSYPEARAPDPELEQTALEISRLLRNARLTQKHLEHQKILAAVTAQSADAIYITDPLSRIVSWNTAAAALFQHPPSEALGQSADFLIPQDRRQEYAELNRKARREGCVRNFESVHLRRDGGLVPVEGTFFLLRDENGLAFGTVRVFRDITQRKEIERMKSEFVSLVIHELRTPLTAIQGYAESIFEFWDELKPGQLRHSLNVILKEARRLGELVTKFLDISRLEAGGVALRPALIDLPELCRRAATLFQEHPGQVGFAIDFAPGSGQAWADEDQLYRVLVNLCGNAVKYSPPGGAITISGRLCGADVEVSVADQGPGIPTQARERLFQKFYRADEPISNQTPGTGLGLAICKSIMEGHHGKIWAESRPGQGATFRFRFPREGLKPS